MYQLNPAMKYDPCNVNSVSELLSNLKGHSSAADIPIWFRGQADASWKLEPKLMRGTHLPETHYFNRFKQDASLILSNKPTNEFEWLFLMQHYGMPTRLLDWSESPLISLYFAITAEPSKDGALWVLLPTILNQKNRYKPDYTFEIPSFEDEHLTNYKPTIIASERKSSLLPMAAIAPRNSSRMQAQQGVFTICHRENIGIEDAGDDPRDHIWKYIIPTASKPLILSELKLLGINKFQLFPELDSLSENFK